MCSEKTPPSLGQSGPWSSGQIRLAIFFSSHDQMEFSGLTPARAGWLRQTGIRSGGILLKRSMRYKTSSRRTCALLSSLEKQISPKSTGSPESYIGVDERTSFPKHLNGNSSCQQPPFKLNMRGRVVPDSPCAKPWIRFAYSKVARAPAVLPSVCKSQPGRMLSDRYRNQPRNQPLSAWTTTMPHSCTLTSNNNR